MFRKNYLILLLFLFFSGCASGPQQYNEWKSKPRGASYYYSLACSASDPSGERKTACGMGGQIETQEGANENALKMCRESYPDCITVKENDNWVYNQRQNQRTTTVGELDKYIGQCEYIGFKRNTEKMGECVLKISQTETKIVNNTGGSDNTLANLIILQESLKVLNPPVQPNRNIKCIFNKVGGIGGVNCF
jgi:hypothetical protein